MAGKTNEHTLRHGDQISPEPSHWAEGQPASSTWRRVRATDGRMFVISSDTRDDTSGASAPTADFQYGAHYLGSLGLPLQLLEGESTRQRSSAPNLSALDALEELPAEDKEWDLDRRDSAAILHMVKQGPFAPIRPPSPGGESSRADGDLQLPTPEASPATTVADADTSREIVASENTLTPGTTEGTPAPGDRATARAGKTHESEPIRVDVRSPKGRVSDHGAAPPSAPVSAQPDGLTSALPDSLAAVWRPSLRRDPSAVPNGRDTTDTYPYASPDVSPQATSVATVAMASGADGAGGGPDVRPNRAGLTQQELHQLVKDTWAASPETRVQWDQFTSVYRQPGKGRARPEQVPRHVLLNFLHSLAGSARGPEDEFPRGPVGSTSWMQRGETETAAASALDYSSLRSNTRPYTTAAESPAARIALSTEANTTCWEEGGLTAAPPATRNAREEEQQDEESSTAERAPPSPPGPSGKTPTAEPAMAILRGGAERTITPKSRLVARVKQLRGEPLWAWRAHCSLHGRGTFDPGWHDPDFLQCFLDAHDEAPLLLANETRTSTKGRTGGGQFRDITGGAPYGESQPRLRHAQ